MQVLNVILRTLALLAAAAWVNLATADNLVEVLFPESIYMYGGVRTERDVGSDVVNAIDDAIRNEADTVHLVVQFRRIITPQEEVLLESGLGIEILEYIPERAYVVAVPTDRVEQILDDLKLASPPRGGVVAIRDSDRLSSRLGGVSAIDVPVHARFLLGTHGQLITAPPVSPPPPGVMAAVMVKFFADVLQDERLAVLDQHNAYGPSLVIPGQGRDDQIQVLLPLDDLKNLLKEDAVRWVEAVPRPPVDDLHEVRQVVDYDTQTLSTNNVFVATSAAGNAGTGVTVAQWETCHPRVGHPGLKASSVAGLLPRDIQRIAIGDTLRAACQGTCDGLPCDFHATMVAGIVMGNGLGQPCHTADRSPGVITGDGTCSVDDFQGMAAKAKGRAYTVSAGFDLTERKLEYEDAMNAGAGIAQNSWGETCDFYSNPWRAAGIPAAFVPYYTSNSEIYDIVASGRDTFGGASGYPGRLLVVASAGNYGDEVGISSLWGSVRVANSAKNVLTVGAVNTHKLQQADKWAHLHSGRGPTADGRLAPVLSAPGIKFNDPDMPYDRSDENSQDAARAAEPESHGIRTTFPPATYKTLWGTSFSTPVVSGAAALLTEAYQKTCSWNPAPAELRALLIHTAHDLKEAYSSFKDVPASLSAASDPDFKNATCGLSGEYVDTVVQQGEAYEGPDYIYGYGMVQAGKAMSFAGDSHFTRGEITRGWEVYTVRVGPDNLEDGKLRVTLAWDDPPWAVNGMQSAAHGLLLNDLDLVLVDPFGKLHLPWVLDPENPAEPAQRHTHTWGALTAVKRDTRNTIEQVVVDNPQPGNWTIHVRAGQLVRPPQAFTLVSSVIAPASPCEDLPATSIEYPLEPPDTWLLWWLFWLALVILILLIIELLRLIFKTHNSPGEWVHVIVALLLLAAVAVLIFHKQLIALGVLLMLLVILAIWLGF